MASLFSYRKDYFNRGNIEGFTVAHAMVVVGQTRQNLH